MTTRENLQELIGIIYDLNQQDSKDWFVDFFGHTDTVGVHNCKPKQRPGSDDYDGKWDFITHGTDTAALNPLIEKLKSILQERQT